MGGMSSNYLQSRLGQGAGDNVQCVKLAAEFLLLAGGEPFTPEARAEHPKVVADADTTLGPPLVSGEQVVEEEATLLPQTDLTTGLFREKRQSMCSKVSEQQGW